jgi:sulfatase modifying factor 1
MSTDGNSGGISFNANAANGGKYGILPGQGNKPITYVTWFSSLRFANWMNNGQGNGDTESGAYTLTGGSQTPANASSIVRNPGANVFLPSENEWYKAAYYKGGGTNAGYWTYATQRNTPPVSTLPSPTAANNANYDDKNTGYAMTGSTGYSAGQNYLTAVGAYGDSPSAYGTFDQTGDVFQWNEALVTGTARGIRGGSWNLDDGALPSTNRDLLYNANYANFFIGFRLASSIPEPTASAAWLIGGSIGLLRRNRR